MFRVRPLVVSAVAAGFVLAVSVEAWAIGRRIFPGGAVLPGVLLDGAPLATPGERLTPDDVAARVAARATVLERRRVALRVDGHAEDAATLRELGVTVDVPETLRRLRIGTVEDPVLRARLAGAARDGGLDVPLALAVDAEALARRIEPLKDALDRPARSARLDLERRGVLPDAPGRALDGDRALADLVRLARGAGDALDLASVVVPAEVTAEALRAVDVSAVLGAFETHFSRRGDQHDRARNIEIAASHLDGVVLGPGETFSFNRAVGDRSEESGFRKAFEIKQGEMVEGVGGGTCQVASTLHAAAFFGGLDVLHRIGHSRPSAYIPMGLDATVVFPSVDLRLRNPHPFPVVLHAKVDDLTLRVEVLGARRLGAVSFGREITSEIPFARRVVEDPELRGSHVVLRQYGMPGYAIARTRRLEAAPGRRERETEATETYAMTPEVWEVPPGFDPARLPPLGETAAPPPVPGDDGAATPPAIRVEIAKGAHAPSGWQRAPAPTFRLTR